MVEMSKVSGESNAQHTAASTTSNSRIIGSYEGETHGALMVVIIPQGEYTITS